MANRVRVSLSHAVLDDHLLAQHQPPHYPRSPAHDQLRETSDFDVELARVVVKNVGRTPIKISGISFDVGRISPLALERRTIALAPIPFKGHATRAKARLEPFDETAVLLDVWAALHEALKAGRTVVLRASVQVSGQRSSTRSPWSQRWTVSPAQLSLRPWRSPEPATIAFEAVWRLLGLRQDAHFLATAIGLALRSRECADDDGRGSFRVDRRAASGRPRRRRQGSTASVVVIGDGAPGRRGIPGQWARETRHCADGPSLSTATTAPRRRGEPQSLIPDRNVTKPGLVLRPGFIGWTADGGLSSAEGYRQAGMLMLSVKVRFGDRTTTRALCATLLSRAPLDQL